MPLLPGRRRRGPDNRPIPAHPYRDTAFVYAGMGVVLVIVASLTGGQAFRAVVAALIFFVIATAWSWWGFRKRIRARDEAAAAETARRTGGPGTRGSANGAAKGNGNGQGRSK
jgi:membrane protein implicated in regulation of membrane protease activity